MTRKGAEELAAFINRYDARYHDATAVTIVSGVTEAIVLCKDADGDTIAYYGPAEYATRALHRTVDHELAWRLRILLAEHPETR